LEKLSDKEKKSFITLPPAQQLPRQAQQQRQLTERQQQLATRHQRRQQVAERQKLSVDTVPLQEEPKERPDRSLKVPQTSNELDYLPSFTACKFPPLVSLDVHNKLSMEY
jgi:hypothetical protein